MIPALFQPLLSTHPDTLEPGAGLATHYEIGTSATEIVFFLRGHPSPRGIRLPGAPEKTGAALWSDGQPVTADDFVFAWRRLVDPATAGNSNYLYPIVNGKQISEGKSAPETLAVCADGQFALHVTLRTSVAYFLKLAATNPTAPVPSHAVQRHASSGLDGMPSCGPWLLDEWRPYDRIVLRKNPRYYDAHRVHLDHIVFLPITNGSTGLNLYKAGTISAMHGRAIPPLWIPALRGREDFHSTLAYRSLFYSFNATRPPFNNVLLRYAFNMATDRKAIAHFLGGGQMPACTVVPPLPGYETITTLPVEVGGRVFDVLAYDPEAARELLSIAGSKHPVVDLTFPDRMRSQEMAQILQRQWRGNLGARVNLLMLETNVWIQNSLSVTYHGIIESGAGLDYADPNSMFDFFTSHADGSGWINHEFDELVDAANAEHEPAIRMRKLATCEQLLLRAMPALPVFFDVYSYLRKPYIRGFTLNRFGQPHFRTAWIDTDWRPS